MLLPPSEAVISIPFSISSVISLKAVACEDLVINLAMRDAAIYRLVSYLV